MVTDIFPVYSHLYHVPRQLKFHFGTNPSVWWDWWIDPESSTYLVREEFKRMCITSEDSRWNPWYDWKAFWPLSYPPWSDKVWYTKSVNSTHPSKKELYDRAQQRANTQQRANRRLRKKASKAARAQGLKKRHPMPGAWPV